EGADLGGEGAVGAVVFQKMGVGLWIGEVVYGNEFDVIRMVVVDSLEDLAADAAEPVDADSGGHGVSLLCSQDASSVYGVWMEVSGVRCQLLGVPEAGRVRGGGTKLPARVRRPAGRSSIWRMIISARECITRSAAM